MANLINQLYSRGINGPLAISGLIAWYDFSDIASLWKDTGRTSAVTANADAIAGVTDKSGTTNHLSQATAGNRPVYTTGAQNGRSVARFTAASNHFMTSPSVTQAQPYTILTVAKVTSTAITNGIVGGTGNIPTLEYRAGVGWTIYTGTLLTSATSNDTNLHQVTGIFNGASSTVRVDAGATNGNAGTTAWSNVMDLGAETPTPSSPMGGDICEVLIYNSLLAGTNLTNAEAYLKARWATP